MTAVHGRAPASATEITNVGGYHPHPGSGIIENQVGGPATSAGDGTHRRLLSRSDVVSRRGGMYTRGVARKLLAGVVLAGCAVSVLGGGVNAGISPARATAPLSALVRGVAATRGTALAASLRAPRPAVAQLLSSQSKALIPNGLALTPPMGWNGYNHFGRKVTAAIVEAAARAMVTSGMKAAGYTYVNLDGGWTCRRAVPRASCSQIPGSSRAGSSMWSTTCIRSASSSGSTPAPAPETARGAAPAATATIARTPPPSPPGASTTSSSTGATSPTRVTRPGPTGRSARCSPGRWVKPSPPPGAASSTTSTTPRSAPRPGPGPRRSPTSGAPPPTSGPTTPAWWPTSSADVRDYATGPTGRLERSGHARGRQREMTVTESRTQFSLWAEMAAPLIAGNDLTTMSPQPAHPHQPAVIAVDQDRLGRQGIRSPAPPATGCSPSHWPTGTAPWSSSTRRAPAPPSHTTVARVGLRGAAAYTLRDLWTGAVTTTAGTISARVPAHGWSCTGSHRPGAVGPLERAEPHLRYPHWQRREALSRGR